MIFPTLHVRLAAAIILATFVVTPTAAQFWEKRCVLLTTDSVIVGLVQQQGDQFRIRQNEGNEIRLNRKQVVAIGSTVRDLYQYKLDRLPKLARGGDHSKIARWCLSVNLLAEAGEHYLLLTQSHPADANHSVKQLGIEITDKMLQQDDFRVVLGLPPLDRSKVALNLSNDSPEELVAKSTSQVVPASTASSPNGSGKIPVRAQTRFAEHTQHILINRCGQSACHGQATQNPFRLTEISGRNAAAQTQQNLDSVLRYVSDDPKSKSTLIEYLTNSHGKMHAPAIGTREVQLANEVANWVQLVQSPVISAEALVQPNLLNPLTPDAPQLRQVPRAPGMYSTDELSEFPEGADIPTAAELDALDAQVRQQQTPAGTATTPASSDPFDPNEFNRQAAYKQ